MGHPTPMPSRHYPPMISAELPHQQSTYHVMTGSAPCHSRTPYPDFGTRGCRFKSCRVYCDASHWETRGFSSGRSGRQRSISGELPFYEVVLTVLPRRSKRATSGYQPARPYNAPVGLETRGVGLWGVALPSRRLRVQQRQRVGRAGVEPRGDHAPRLLRVRGRWRPGRAVLRPGRPDRHGHRRRDQGERQADAEAASRPRPPRHGTHRPPDDRSIVRRPRRVRGASPRFTPGFNPCPVFHGPHESLAVPEREGHDRYHAHPPQGRHSGQSHGWPRHRERGCRSQKRTGDRMDGPARVASRAAVDCRPGATPSTTRVQRDPWPGYRSFTGPGP
jgi:hypothetical protein